ncbi:MAG: hypothetical protein QXJ75_06125 [Candidatus Bathyarchaeia archaeon]
MDEGKYKVVVKVPERPIKVSREKMSELKGVVKGGLLKRMKQEAVDCPVRNETVAFIECFTCNNFIRRVKGEVDCRGNGT